jgi:hypothetical protein
VRTALIPPDDISRLKHFLLGSCQTVSTALDLLEIDADDPEAEPQLLAGEPSVELCVGCGWRKLRPYLRRRRRRRTSCRQPCLATVAGTRRTERPLLYRGIRQERLWQIASQGLVLSSRSAPGRLMMGLDRWGGSIFGASLPMMVDRVCGRYELTSPVVPVGTPSCRSRTR